ncbi:O-antigen ligase family protein [Pseudomonadota bacterium]
MKGVLFLLGGWLLYSLIQILPAPIGLLETISPATANIYAYSNDVVNSGAISIDVGSSAGVILQNAAYVTLLLLVVVLVSTKNRLRILTYTIIFSGLVQAVFGLYVMFTGAHFIPVEYLDGHFDRATGTFINRNHYSIFIVMSLFLLIGLIVSTLKRQKTTFNWKNGIRALVRGLTDPKSTLLGLAIVMIPAILYSKSRGGLGALFGGLIITTILISLRTKGTNYGRKILPILGIIGILSVAWLGYGEIFGRISYDQVAQMERFTQWRLSVGLVMDHWLLGIGLGNYEWLFPLYKSGDLNIQFFYDHAHNDYLELLVEQGVVGFVILGCAIVLILKKTISALLNRRDPFLIGILYGSLGALLAMLIHSFFEFNFHIPATAAYFFVIAGLGLSSTVMKHNA